MKEATGELNMTVVTLVAIAAILALFSFVIWPIIKRMIVQQTCETYGTDWHAEKTNAASTGVGDEATEDGWACCPGSVAPGTVTNDCMAAN